MSNTQLHQTTNSMPLIETPRNPEIGFCEALHLRSELELILCAADTLFPDIEQICQDTCVVLIYICSI